MTLAAIFVDFENIFYFLRNSLDAAEEATKQTLELVRKLRDRLTQDGQMPILQYAYGDFDRLPDNVQTELYLQGLEPRHVVGRDHKNAADMQLCIDALETLYTRERIETFVIVGGDRDYIPVVQHLRKNARLVRCVAFAGGMSGDLKQVLGEAGYWEANQFLPHAVVQPVAKAKAVAAGAGAGGKHAVPAKPVAASFEPIAFLEGDERSALEIMLQHYGTKKEIWVKPYLYKLRDALPWMEERERQELLNGLAGCGAVKIEKRQGDPNPYSVIIVNWNHPDVQKLHGAPHA